MEEKITAWVARDKQGDLYLYNEEPHKDNKSSEWLIGFDNGYRYSSRTPVMDDLVLKVPDNEPQFKPFDRVLVRQSDKDDWRVALYSHFNPEENIHVTAWLNWYQCIPYEGNKHLVGTTDKPRED